MANAVTARTPAKLLACCRRRVSAPRRVTQSASSAPGVWRPMRRAAGVTDDVACALREPVELVKQEAGLTAAVTDNDGAVLSLRAVQAAQSAMLLPDGRGAAPPRMATHEQQESAA